MMKQTLTGEALKTWLWRWGPALGIMAAIFTASSFSKSEVPDFGVWDWVVKKSGHLLGYSLLGAAYLRGLANGARPTLRQALFAICLAGLYGVTDEFHQSFVAGRGARPTDVLIDTLGAVIGAGAWGYGRRR